MATADHEIRIVLLGKTGAGKSSLGNKLLGKRVFDSKAGASSVTAKCDIGICILPNNKKLIVVDTPGLYDSHRSNDETCREIAKCIGLSAPGVHAFIIVIRIGRFTPEEFQTIKKLQALFGERVSKHAFVVFTGKSGLDADEQSVDEFIKNSPENLKLMLRQCGGRYLAVDNLAKGEELEGYMKDIRNLIYKTIAFNDGGYYTDNLYSAAEKAIQKLMNSYAELATRHKVRQEIIHTEKGIYRIFDLGQISDRCIIL